MPRRPISWSQRAGILAAPRPRARPAWPPPSRALPLDLHAGAQRIGGEDLGVLRAYFVAEHGEPVLGDLGDPRRRPVAEALHHLGLLVARQAHQLVDAA